MAPRHPCRSLVLLPKKMQWEKASQEDADLLSSRMAKVECERRIMFGYPAYFNNKNMFA
jgi:hypothetical protein